MWLLNWDFVLKDLPSGQTEHLKFLTSLWVAWCRTNVNLWANFLSQIWQANGFSPVWIAWCRTNEHLCEKFLSQSWQANAFSPVCIL